MDEWPIIDPLPSYGRGRERLGGRHISLIHGDHLTNVIITGILSTWFVIIIVESISYVWWCFHNEKGGTQKKKKEDVGCFW